MKLSFTFIPAADPEVEDSVTSLDNTNVFIQHCFDGAFMLYKELPNNQVEFYPDNIPTLAKAKRAAINVSIGYTPSGKLVFV